MTERSIHSSQKKSLKYFLRKILILLFVIIAIDYTAGSILRYFYFKQQNGEAYRITYALEKTNEDVLIFGSSRANHHYHPAIFEKRLHLPFYNTGIDGEHIFYQYAILEGVLKRYSPKIVIFDFIAEEFIKDRESYERLSMLLPYYKSHPEIRSIVEMKSRFEKYKLASGIYPFNSMAFPIALGNTSYKKNKKEDIKGYMPLDEIWDEPLQTRNYPEDYPLDSNKIKVFESIIKSCAARNIKLYFVCSPYYFKTDNLDKSILLAQAITKKYHIDFIDFSHDYSFLSNHNLFADFAHLNDKGARLFSEKLVDSLEKIDQTLAHKLALR